MFRMSKIMSDSGSNVTEWLCKSNLKSCKDSASLSIILRRDEYDSTTPSPELNKNLIDVFFTVLNRYLLDQYESGHADVPVVVLPSNSESKIKLLNRGNRLLYQTTQEVTFAQQLKSRVQIFNPLLQSHQDVSIVGLFSIEPSKLLKTPFNWGWLDVTNKDLPAGDKMEQTRNFFEKLLSYSHINETNTTSKAGKVKNNVADKRTISLIQRPLPYSIGRPNRILQTPRNVLFYLGLCLEHLARGKKLQQSFTFSEEDERRLQLQLISTVQIHSPDTFTHLPAQLKNLVKIHHSSIISEQDRSSTATTVVDQNEDLDMSTTSDSLCSSIVQESGVIMNGSELFQLYQQNHPITSETSGKWLSIRPHEANQFTLFFSYKQAARQHKSSKDWICLQLPVKIVTNDQFENKAETEVDVEMTPVNNDNIEDKSKQTNVKKKVKKKPVDPDLISEEDRYAIRQMVIRDRLHGTNRSGLNPDLISNYNVPYLMSDVPDRYSQIPSHLTNPPVSNKIGPKTVKKKQSIPHEITSPNSIPQDQLLSLATIPKSSKTMRTPIKVKSSEVEDQPPTSIILEEDRESMDNLEKNMDVIQLNESAHETHQPSSEHQDLKPMEDNDMIQDMNIVDESIDLNESTQLSVEPSQSLSELPFIQNLAQHKKQIEVEWNCSFAVQDQKVVAICRPQTLGDWLSSLNDSSMNRLFQKTSTRNEECKVSQREHEWTPLHDTTLDYTVYRSFCSKEIFGVVELDRAISKIVERIPSPLSDDEMSIKTVLSPVRLHGVEKDHWVWLVFDLERKELTVVVDKSVSLQLIESLLVKSISMINTDQRLWNYKHLVVEQIFDNEEQKQQVFLAHLVFLLQQKPSLLSPSNPPSSTCQIMSFVIPKTFSQTLYQSFSEQVFSRSLWSQCLKVYAREIFESFNGNTLDSALDLLFAHYHFEDSWWFAEDPTKILDSNQLLLLKDALSFRESRDVEQQVEQSVVLDPLYPSILKHFLTRLSNSHLVEDFASNTIKSLSNVPSTLFRNQSMTKSHFGDLYCELVHERSLSLPCRYVDPIRTLFWLSNQFLEWYDYQDSPDRLLNNNMFVQSYDFYPVLMNQWSCGDVNGLLLQIRTLCEETLVWLMRDLYGPFLCRLSEEREKSKSDKKCFVHILFTTYLPSEYLYGVKPISTRLVYDQKDTVKNLKFMFPRSPPSPNDPCYQRLKEFIDRWCERFLSLIQGDNSDIVWSHLQELVLHHHHHSLSQASCAQTLSRTIDFSKGVHRDWLSPFLTIHSSFTHHNQQSLIGDLLSVRPLKRARV